MFAWHWDLLNAMYAAMKKNCEPSVATGDDKDCNAGYIKMYFLLPDNGLRTCNFSCFFYIGDNDIYVGLRRAALLPLYVPFQV